MARPALEITERPEHVTLDELRALATGDRDGYPCWEGDFGAMAVTLPEAEFLHALVAMTRPKEILELGTGTGISGRFIAEAAGLYGGRLVTVERSTEFADRAKKLLDRTLPVEIVTSYANRDETNPDLVYVDSAVNWRSADLVNWLGYRRGPLVVLHDANRIWPELRMGEGFFVESQAGFWIGRGE